MNLRRTASVIATALAAASIVAAPASAAGGQASGPNCTPLLKAAAHGKSAEAALGANFDAAAARNNKSPDQLRTLLEDDSFWLDRCGSGYYVEQGQTAGPVEVAPAAAFPYSQTFLLHSNPTASKTIYLDFTGYTSTGTAWNAGTIVANPYNTDGNSAAFSNGEMDVIQKSWAVVAEDFSSFDVDVTTEEPLAARLERASSSDTEYGTRAVITQNTMGLCSNSCGGVAYVGVFNATGTTHEYYQPAWVFNSGFRGVSEAISHEVGHNLGLSHDGTAVGGLGYYQGTGGWAPIMGVGYYEPIVQWSKGEYPDANNTEDDFSVMRSYGLTERADEDSNTAASARTASAGTTYTGVISSRTDTDWFAFTPSVSTTYTFAANGDSVSPNLDIRMDLYDSTQTSLAFNDPSVTRVSNDVATGLNASLSQSLTGGQTYYVKLDGIGRGSWATGADYNDYSSIGQYGLTITSSIIAVGTSSLPSGTVNRPYNTTLVAAGGTAPFAWSATGLPAGLSLNSSTGAITGTPGTAGTSSVAVTVTDALSSTASATLSLTIAAAPSITTTSLAGGTTGTAYSATLAASGGVAPYAWSATGLPGGLTIGAGTGTISGTPTVTGVFNVSAQVTEANGATASKSLSLTVTAPPLSISTGSLPGGTAGTAYVGSVAATGGTPGYTFSSSSLPPGVTLNAGTGALGGVPTTGGTYSVVINVSDSASATASKTFSVTISVATLTITTRSLSNGTRNVAYSQQLASTGGQGAKTWSYTGTIPAGLTLNASTGVLSGTPTTRATYKFTVTVRDSSSPQKSSSKAFQIKIA